MSYHLELDLREKSYIIQSLAVQVKELSEVIDTGVPGHDMRHEVLDDYYQLLVKVVKNYDAEILKRGVINLASGRDLVKKSTSGEVEIRTPV